MRLHGSRDLLPLRAASVTLLYGMEARDMQVRPTHLHSLTAELLTLTPELRALVERQPLFQLGQALQRQSGSQKEPDQKEGSGHE